MSSKRAALSVGLSFGVASSGAAPSFVFGTKAPAGAGAEAASQPAATSAPPISYNFQSSQVRAPLVLLVMVKLVD